MKHSVPSFIFTLLSFVLCLISCILILSSCTEPTKPPVDNGPDTTSHNFSWTIDTIGTRNSYLKDVAIINENDIWAVGEIHTDETDRWNEDSTEWIKPFNAVHWNGIEWEYKRTLPSGKGFSPNRSVFAFSSNDIWVGTSAPYHWDGQEWTAYNVTGIHNGYINKIWGTSSQDMYFVGTNGSITHYDGQSWQRLESGTDIDIVDIWGSQNVENNKYEILAAASTNFHIEKERHILRIDGNTVSFEPDSGLAINLSTIWFKAGKTYYAAGDGLYIRENNELTWKKETDQLGYYKSEVRGININDVFVTGSFGLLSHYNGNNWKHYTGKELPYFYGSWHSLDVISDYIVAVGERSGKGLILRGKRN